MKMAKSKALVTGSTSGIGRAAAFALARDGFEVIVHGRDGARGAEVVREIEAEGGTARFFAADLTRMEDVQALAREAADVDVLVNNSGIAWIGPTADLTLDRYEAMYAGNVRATYFLTAAIAPKMAERGRGNVVNVGSVVGSVGWPGGAAYSGTKAALEAMTRAWAAELAPRGVRVNAVAPGPTITSIAKKDRIEALGRTTLLGRAGRDHEIAEVIAFLASERASYVTGATFAVDGGQRAGL